MARRHDDALAKIIRLAMPFSAAKRIALALGCSHRQGRSILAGRAPSRLRAALLVLLDAEIARTKQLLLQAEHAIHEEQVIEDRAEDSAAHPGMAAGSVRAQGG